MFKKSTYFVYITCMIGLFFSAAVYANPTKITSNDSTPIRQFVFFGGAYFYDKTSSYPISYVSTNNVIAITPLPNEIKYETALRATYDIATPGEYASVYAWFNNHDLQVGMAVNEKGALESTICHASSTSPLYLINCNVNVLNGVASIEIFLIDKKK